MKKRVLSLALALVLMIGVMLLMGTPALAAIPDTSWYYDNPHAEPFKIGTADQLAGLAKLVNEERLNFFGRTILLVSDIDLSGYQSGSGWIPIGGGILNAASFSGTFDGQGHVIRNLKITNHDWHTHGLFGRILDATIENIGLEGAIINVDTAYNSTRCIGGIVAIAQRSIIRNCYNKGGAISGIAGTVGSYFGGIAGDFSSSSSNVTIENCYNTSNISCEATLASYVGGIVGGNISGTSSTVSNSYNMGNVTVAGPSVHAGGIGGSYSGLIRDCYNRGTVSSNSGSVAYAGGLAQGSIATLTGLALVIMQVL